MCTAKSAQLSTVVDIVEGALLPKSYVHILDFLKLKSMGLDYCVG